MFEIKRQQFLEDIECCHSDELDIVGLLARAKELQDKCTKEEFNTLCSYLTLPNLRDHPEFKHWSAEQGRIACFEKILELLKTVPFSVCETDVGLSGGISLRKDEGGKTGGTAATGTAVPVRGPGLQRWLRRGLCRHPQGTLHKRIRRTCASPQCGFLRFRAIKWILEASSNGPRPHTVWWGCLSRRKGHRLVLR